MNRSRITGDLVSQNNIFVDIANDRVGIGSTIPGEKLSLPDSAKIALGNSADLQIFHDGSQSYIKDNGTGQLYIQSSAALHLENSNGSKKYFRGVNGGAAELYYDGNKKIETTNTGITVTGRLTIDGLDLGDSETIRLGASQDLQLFHNGNHSYISDLGTGDLRITGSAVHIQNAAQSENMIKCFEGAQVELYHNNSKKFQSTAYGVNVTGTTDTDGLVVSGITTMSGDLTISSSFPRLKLTDTDNNSDFSVDNGNGTFRVRDVTNGVDRLRIDSNGRIGLGIANPDAYFSSYNRVVMGRTNDTGGMTIVSSTTSGGYISFADGTSGNAAYRGMIAYQHNGDYMTFGTDGGNERLRINSGGNVGIGTNNPITNLHISGTGQNVLRVDSSGQAISIYNHTEFIGYIGNESGALFINAGGTEDTLLLKTNGSERLRITNDGKVGINSASPEKQLTLRVGSGDDGGILVKPNVNYASNQNRAYLIVGTDNWTGATTNWGTYGFQHRLKTNGSGVGRVTIDTSSGEAFCIENGGNIGIGTDDPSQILHIHDANPIIQFTDTSGLGSRINAESGNLYLDTHNNNRDIIFRGGNSSTDEVARITGDGNVGIGTNSPYNTGLDVRFPLTGVASFTSLANGTQGANVNIIHTKSGITDNDKVGQVSFSGGALGSATTYAQIRTIATDISNKKGDIAFYTRNGNNTTGSLIDDERVRIFSDGNLGVGDYSSTSLTHAIQALRTSGTTVVSTKNTGGNATFYAEASNTNTAKLELFQAGTSGYSLRTGSTDALQFFRDSTYLAQFDSSGRLLIGHTTSQQSTSMLQVSRANNSTIRVASSDSTATNFAALDLAPANSIAGARVVAVAVGTFANTSSETAYLKFETRNSGTTSEKLRITSGGQVNIGGDYSQTTYKTQIETTNGNVLRLVTDSDDANGVELVLRKDSASPADNDNIGNIYFQGNDSGGNATFYSSMEAYSDDVTNGSENGYIRFRTRNDGTMAERLRITSGGQVNIARKNQSSPPAGNGTFTAIGLDTDGGDLATGRIFLQGYQKSADTDFMTGINNEGSSLVLYDYSNNHYKQKWHKNGGTELWCAGSKKFETQSGGIAVTGNVDCDGIRMGDSEEIRVGNSDDLIISHNGTDSIIHNNTGALLLQTDGDFKIEAEDGGKDIIHGVATGACEIHHNGSRRIETTSTGAKITGVNGSNPTLQIEHSNVDTEGEVVRIERMVQPTIRYHSIKSRHSGSTNNNHIAFHVHSADNTTAQTEALKILGSGNLTYSQQAMTILVNPTDESTINTNDNDDPIHFDTTYVNKGGMTVSESISRITVPLNGTYLLTGCISGSVTSESQGDGIQLAAMKNGSDTWYDGTSSVFPIETFGTEDGMEYAFTFSIPTVASANDYFEMTFLNLGGAVGNANRGYFSVTKLH